ncbi:MAG: hypothetical protein ACI4BB_10605 [Coprococcus sp.]
MIVGMIAETTDAMIVRMTAETDVMIIGLGAEEIIIRRSYGY